MRATQVVHWTRSPSLAIAADGRVVATNEACDRLIGLPPEAVNGMRCWDVVRATDAGGARVCRPTGCPTLEALGSGHATDLEWSGWLLDCGAVVPVQATAIAVPQAERDDRAAAVILLHPDPQQPEPAQLEPGTPTSSPAHTRADVGTGEDVSPPAVRIRLFGRPECWNGDERQQVTRRRAVELLALLALSGEDGCTRESIVDKLWPDTRRGNGRQHLRVLLHAIRKALGAGSVVEVHHQPARETRLRLGPDVWVDLTAFEAGARLLEPPAGGNGACLTDDEDDRLQRLEETIALYRGELDECGEFGEWAVPHRERLQRQFLSLLTEVIPALARRGRTNDAVAYCRRAVEADPFAEPFQVALLTAYGWLGRQTAALDQYRDYRRTLARELALAPSAAVERAFKSAMACPAPGTRTGRSE